MSYRMPMQAAQELSGEVEIISGCRLGYRLRYPFFPEYPAVSGWYARQVELYVRYIHSSYLPVLQQMPLDALGSDLTIEGSYEVQYARGDLLSVTMDTYEDLGMYSCALGRTSVVWGLHSGRRLEFDDLFRDPAKVRDIMETHILREIGAAPAGSYYVGAWQREPRWFYFSEGGLCIYYQPGTITSRNSGIPTFYIPWTELRGCVNFPL